MGAEGLVGEPVVVGDLQVTPLSDGRLRFPPTEFFPGTTDAEWHHHRRWLDDEGMLALPMTSFLVRAPGATVLVDCGLGFDAGPDWRGGRLGEALAAAGTPPSEVDVVLLTHLHADHVGWTSMDGATPYFDRAAYRCHAADWAWARDIHAGLFHRRLAPVEERLSPVGDDEVVAPGVTVRTAPGHTPGHLVVVLSGRGERALLLGDAVHCPVQLTETDWTAFGDVDPAGAARTRERLLAEVDGADIVGSAHFPGLRFGRLVTGGEGRSWTPLA